MKAVTALTLALVACLVVYDRAATYREGHISAAYADNDNPNSLVWLRAQTNGEMVIVYEVEGEGWEELRFIPQANDVRKLLNAVARECRSLGIQAADPAPYGRMGILGPSLEVDLASTKLLDRVEYVIYEPGKPLPPSIVDILKPWIKEAEKKAAARGIVKRAR